LDAEQTERVIRHIGIIRRSGRYPYGSGGDAYQGSVDFKADLDDMRSQGLSDSQIAQGLGIKTTELRDAIALSTEIVYAANQSMAVHLRNEKQMSVRQIAKRMLGSEDKESTVRGWLKNAEKTVETSILSIANKLKEHLGMKGFVDVGKGEELYLGVSDTRLRASLYALKNEGYVVHLVKVPQLGTDKLTEHKVLCPPGTTWGEAKDAVLAAKVYTIKDKSPDGGLTFMSPKAEPVSVSSKRIEVRYAEDGGTDMDGVIQVRRGVPELDLGANRYAQVRVAVDGTHYLKGMAIYADDLPPGTDIRFNTNKSVKAVGTSKTAVMKPLKDDPTNRFGATVRPHIYKDKNGKEITSALNMVNEEGDWDKWTNSLSSQMLSKQPITVAAQQLAKTQATKQKELDRIMALTNPVVKKQMLLDFAESADSAAVHLKAASMPRQASQVILPMNSMRPGEVYAPGFRPGEKVALVRHPHGGPFEIPNLTVNNSNRTAKRLMGNARDAIGIHHSVAQQLSGADFDGDSVLVIPNNSGKIKYKDPLIQLKDFDPKVQYPEAAGMKYMTKANTQKEMGKISNLITDMTIKGANTSEIARAVKHSMVVIDAENHKLDYKQSEKDNGIAQLKKTYQGGANKGASTIISRSGAEARVPQQRLRRQSEGGSIDPKTGELVYVPTGKTYTKTTVNPRTGEKVSTTKPATTKGTKGEFTKDAHTLSSGEPIERVYANHANSMKAMANAARKTAVSIKDPPVSPAAKAIYAKEVSSLRAKVKNAQMNAPLERRAQIIANATARARIDNNPDLDKDDIKKIKYQSLADARLQTGAAKERIGSTKVPFLKKEWEAIQSGAVSSTFLREILNNSDMDTVKQLATPKYNSSLTPGQLALAKSMAASGRGAQEIADALGIPRSTIVDNLNNA
jgi:hypothetical protein